MKLLNCELVEILKSEQKMEEYLESYEDSAHKIDPVIWQIHFSVPIHKRMAILNAFFKRFLSKMKTLHSFLPPNMILAKVYRTLNIPYTLMCCNKSPDSYTVSVTKFSKSHRVSKFRPYYNSLPRKTRPPSTPNIYDFSEEKSSDYMSYTLFRRILQLSRSIARRKEQNNAFDNNINKSSRTASDRNMKTPSSAIKWQRQKKDVLNKSFSKFKGNISNTKRVLPSSSNAGAPKPISLNKSFSKSKGSISSMKRLFPTSSEAGSSKPVSLLAEKGARICKVCPKQKGVEISNKSEPTIQKKNSASSATTPLATSKVTKSLTCVPNRARMTSAVSDANLDLERYQPVLHQQESVNSVDMQICPDETAKNTTLNAGYVEENWLNAFSGGLLTYSRNRRRHDKIQQNTDMLECDFVNNDNSFDEIIDSTAEEDENGQELNQSEKRDTDSLPTREGKKYEVNPVDEFRIDSSILRSSNSSESSQTISLIESRIFSKYENSTVIISSSERRIESVTSTDEEAVERSNIRTENSVNSSAAENRVSVERSSIIKPTVEHKQATKLSQSLELNVTTGEQNSESIFELNEEKSPKLNDDLKSDDENNSAEEFSELNNIAEEANIGNKFHPNEERSQSIELDFGAEENSQREVSKSEANVNVTCNFFASPFYYDLRRSSIEGGTLKEAACREPEDTILAYDTNSEIENNVEISSEKTEITTVKASTASELSVSSLRKSPVISKSRETGSRKNKYIFDEDDTISASSSSNWPKINKIGKNKISVPRIISSDSETTDAVPNSSVVCSESRVTIPEKVIGSAVAQKRIGKETLSRKLSMSTSCGSISTFDKPVKRNLYNESSDFNNSRELSQSKSCDSKGSKRISRELVNLRTKKWVLQNFGTASSRSSNDIFTEKEPNRSRHQNSVKQSQATNDSNIRVKRLARSSKTFERKEIKKAKKSPGTKALTQFKQHKILKDVNRLSEKNEIKTNRFDEHNKRKERQSLAEKQFPSNIHRKVGLTETELQINSNQKSFSQIIDKSIDDDSNSDTFTSSTVITSELQRLSLDTNENSWIADSDCATDAIMFRCTKESNQKRQLDNAENICEPKDEINFGNLTLDYVEDTLKRMPRVEDYSDRESDSSFNFRFGSQSRQNFEQYIDSDASEEEVFRDYRNQCFSQNWKKSPKKNEAVKSAFQDSQKVKISHYQKNQSLQKSTSSCPHKQSSVVPSDRLKVQTEVNKSTPLNDSVDEYGSDELTLELNNNLSKWNNKKDPDEDNESIVSRSFDADINLLLKEYAALNSEQSSASPTSSKKYASCELSSDVTGKIKSKEESQYSNWSSFNDNMWESYPDSMESALTTPDEKLEEVRGGLKKLFNEKGMWQQLKKKESSKDSDTDGANFSDL